MSQRLAHFRIAKAMRYNFFYYFTAIMPYPYLLNTLWVFYCCRFLFSISFLSYQSPSCIHCWYPWLHGHSDPSFLEDDLFFTGDHWQTFLGHLSLLIFPQMPSYHTFLAPLIPIILTRFRPADPSPTLEYSVFDSSIFQTPKPSGYYQWSSNVLVVPINKLETGVLSVCFQYSTTRKNVWVLISKKLYSTHTLLLRKPRGASNNNQKWCRNIETYSWHRPLPPLWWLDRQRIEKCTKSPHRWVFPLI